MNKAVGTVWADETVAKIGTKKIHNQLTSISRDFPDCEAFQVRLLLCIV